MKRPVFTRSEADGIMRYFIEVEDVEEEKPYEVLLIIAVTAVIFGMVIILALIMLYNVRIRVLRSRKQ